MQFKFKNYEFNMSWLGLALVVLCVPTFIKLGLWQYEKASVKLMIDKKYQSSLKSNTELLKNHLHQPEVLQYKKVSVEGHYVEVYQLLIDNQVENSEAGFHVITPFKIAGTNRFVLVNRGWLKGMADHQKTPNYATPTNVESIEGMVWLPSNKIFTLEAKTQSENIGQNWRLVWQHLDMKKYQRLAPINTLDVIIKLDPKQSHGFVRNWQLPPSRIATHLGYAYQWFGFAFATIAIFLYMNINRVNNKE